MKLEDYPIEELNELLDAVMFTRTWDEDYPDQNNDPNGYLKLWEERLKEIGAKPKIE